MLMVRQGATSESAWLHAINHISEQGGPAIDWVLAPQVTSPLRQAKDVQNGIAKASTGEYDSLFSCSIAEDLFFSTLLLHFYLYNQKHFQEMVHFGENSDKHLLQLPLDLFQISYVQVLLASLNALPECPCHLHSNLKC